MPPEHAILLPPTALAFLTGIVLIRAYYQRISELRARRIHPQKLATARDASAMLENVQAADNFRNLFEAPVLFYALCAFLAITGLADALLLACAWGYVLLRAYHSYIHLTHNTVLSRFRAFIASTIVLYAMWGIFAVRLLSS
jgi:hypothetical protein